LRAQVARLYIDLDQMLVTQHTHEGFHMKRTIINAIMGSVAGLWLAAAHAAAPDPQWLGTWELDVAKSERPVYASATPAPPKSVTYTFKDVGGGKWSYQQVVVLSDGKKVEPAAGTFTTDGSPSPVSDPQFDSVTVTYPDSHTEVVTFFKAGKILAKQTTKLSADGKQRSSSVESTDKDGKPVHTTQIWNKK
jgi:hypothetical protein